MPTETKDGVIVPAPPADDKPSIPPELGKIRLPDGRTVENVMSENKKKSDEIAQARAEAAEAKKQADEFRKKADQALDSVQSLNEKLDSFVPKQKEQEFVEPDDEVQRIRSVVRNEMINDDIEQANEMFREEAKKNGMTEKEFAQVVAKYAWDIPKEKLPSYRYGVAIKRFNAIKAERDEIQKQRDEIAKERASLSHISIDSKPSVSSTQINALKNAQTPADRQKADLDILMGNAG